MDALKNFIEGVTVPLLLSLFGGAARAMRYGVGSWRQFSGSLLVSSFAGVVVHLLLQETDLAASVKAALVGLSGYSGGVILDGLAARLQRGVEHLPGRAYRPVRPGQPGFSERPELAELAELSELAGLEQWSNPGNPNTPNEPNTLNGPENRKP